MNKLFLNNTFLKIFSVVASVLCWIYIVFITNPSIEVTITGIPITLSDHQSIKNEGYIVSNDINSTVDLKLKGTRKMLAGINKDNIIAYIDLSGCTKKSTYKLPVNIKLPYEEVKVVNKSIYNVTVAVDNLISRDFEIECAYSGELQSSAYTVNSTELSAKKVNVKGPEDIIKTIEKARVTIDIDNASADVSGSSYITLLNSNNAVISSGSITLNKPSVDYLCEIYQRKSFAVKPSVSENASSVKVSVTDHPTVTLIGPADEIDKITTVSTADITFNPDALPHTVSAKLIIPKNIKVEDEITTVNVLVENK